MIERWKKLSNIECKSTHHFLFDPFWMKCVRVMFVSNIDLCFKPPNWLGWIKLFEIKWNWSLSPMNFLMSFPKVLRSMIGLKESYDSLLGFGMIMDVNILKWDGQLPNLKHTSVILIILFRHELFLTIHLRYL